MTLQSSGSIDLTDIQTEFGGSNPISIDEYVYYRTAGRDYAHGTVVDGFGGLAFSDFYDGDNLPVYEGIMNIGGSQWDRTKTWTTTSQTKTGTNTNTFTEYITDSFLWGYDGDTEYLGSITRASGTNPTFFYTWLQETDTFGSIGTITTRGSFSGRTIEGLYWSQERLELYLILDNNSTPAFTSLGIGGNAYRSEDLNSPGGPSTFLDAQTSTNRSVYIWSAPTNPFGKVVTFVPGDVNTSSEIVTTNFNSPEVLTHGYWTGCRVRLTTTGTLPGGLSTSTDYYIIDSTSQTFKFASSRENAYRGNEINLTSGGTGTHTVTPRHQIWITG